MSSSSSVPSRPVVLSLYRALFRAARPKINNNISLTSLHNKTNSNIKLAFAIRKQERSEKIIRNYIEQGKSMLKFLNTFHALPPQQYAKFFRKYVETQILSNHHSNSLAGTMQSPLAFCANSSPIINKISSRSFSSFSSSSSSSKYNRDYADTLDDREIAEIDAQDFVNGVKRRESDDSFVDVYDKSKLAKTHLKSARSATTIDYSALKQMNEALSKQEISEFKAPQPQKSPSAMNPEEIRAELRCIYREMWSYITHLAANNKQNLSNEDIRRQIRTGFKLSGEANPDLSKARSSLSYLRMQVPARYHRNRPLAAGNAHYIMNNYGEFVLASGELQQKGAKSRVYNSQGITEEQMKRHHSLMERFQFRGPKWETKK
jgi:hypothetical protein